MIPPKNRDFICPNCGEVVPANSSACPHCGSDERTGWADHTYLDGMVLPADDEEYEEIKEREFGKNFGKKKVGLFDDISWKTVIAVMAICAIFSSIVLRGC